MPAQVGDLGYASELGNYAEYSGAPKEEEVLQYARVVIDVGANHDLYVIMKLHFCSMFLLLLFFFSYSSYFQVSPDYC